MCVLKVNMPSCSAYKCTNRYSRGSSVKFHRFPLGDSSRLQRWLVNLRWDNWKPTPFSRICSLHFEENCFFTNGQGQVRLTKTAVPTIFSFPEHLQKKVRCTRLRQTSLERTPPVSKEARGHNDPLHGFSLDHTYSLTEDASLTDSNGKKDCSETAEFDKEEVVLEPDMAEGSRTSEIYPSEQCGVSVSRKPSVCSYTNHTCTVDESPETLKRILALTQEKLKACRKRLKMRGAQIRRLKKKVSLLSSNRHSRSEREMLFS
ncbi:THAP domain-containing protein [Myxocyprinus asiaticus]|uniref:THAP domain-containing protein n=1 Tax=Myxocyprinus asiaticus TaxID=70543 RepID=UPI002222B31C|nr:THAP domain-containing protein [Myxocyprinus asiaticus]